MNNDVNIVISILSNWVLFNGEPMRLRSVLESRGKGSLSDLIDNNRGDAVQPVSITTEMLAKNGFEHSYAADRLGEIHKWRKEDGLRQITVWKVGSRFELGGLGCQRVRYVHELQEVMRLFGLTVMADNFEI